MKKTIVLMTIVLAILAAPVFAEVTASGSVEFDWAFAADDNYEQNIDNTASIDLGGVVGDFSTISVVVEDGDLNAMTLTQDVTGALGVDGPVGFSYKVGKMDYTPVVYNEVAPKSIDVMGAKAGVKVVEDEDNGTLVYDYDTDSINATTRYADTANMLGFKLMFALADMVNVDVALYPASMMAKETGAYYDTDDEKLEMGINAYGTFGMVDASVFYVASAALSGAIVKDPDTNKEWKPTDAADTTGNRMGLSLSAAPIENLTVGFGLETALSGQKYIDTGVEMAATVTKVAVDAAYVLDALTAGVSVKTAFSDEDSFFVDGEKVELMNVTEFKVSGKYAVTEAVNMTAAFGMPLAAPHDAAGELDFINYGSYEVGADMTLDGVTYGLGYTLNSDYAAYDAQRLNEAMDEKVANVYFNIKASF